jgi:AAA+ superfamily predicted ATPase
MENFDGIMIATTNLTDNLDAAFERRFLYKIEFPKPTPQESRHIWKSMLPELQEESALELAKQYNFSGGQIENIARKHIVSTILSGEDTLSLDAIREACNNERLNSKKNKQIGFY